MSVSKMNAQEARIKLDELLKEAQRQRDLRAKAEANLESAVVSLKSIEDEIEAMGLAPDKLTEYIEGQEAEISALLESAEKLLSRAK